MMHFFVGSITLVLGVCGIAVWWCEFGEFLRGAVPILFVLLGLAAIGAGIKSHSGEAEFEHPEEPNDMTTPDQAD